LRVAHDSLIRNQGAIDTRASQIANQQSALDNCLVQLGKAQQAEPLRVTAHLIPSSPTRTDLRVVDKLTKVVSDQKVKAFERTYVVVANRTITPIRLGVECPVKLLYSAHGRVLGTGAMTTGGWGGRLSMNSYGIGILSPAWSPINPILATVQAAEDPHSCRFDLR
jgi:hypothetical protein